MVNVLLDFDGVIFKNTKIHKLVEQKSIEYVAKALNVPMKKATKISNYNYKKNGHTTISYNKEHGLNIHDYNEFLFDNMNWNEIKAYLNKNDFDNLDIYKRICNRDNINYYLYSNASLSYCVNVLKHLNYDLFEQETFTSSNCELKPLCDSYHHVENTIHQLNNHKLHFIDDNMINLKPIQYNVNWSTYLLDTINEDTIENILNTIHYQEAHVSPENPSKFSNGSLL